MYLYAKKWFWWFKISQKWKVNRSQLERKWIYSYQYFILKRQADVRSAALCENSCWGANSCGLTAEEDGLCLHAQLYWCTHWVTWPDKTPQGSEDDPPPLPNNICRKRKLGQRADRLHRRQLHIFVLLVKTTVPTFWRTRCFDISTWD